MHLNKFYKIHNFIIIYLTYKKICVIMYFEVFKERVK